VSVMAVSVQISSPARQPVPHAASLAAPSRSAGVQGGGSVAKLPATTVFPSGGGQSGAGSVHQLLRSLPSVSPVVGNPSTLPSLPALPLPTSLPSLP
jgi:hypothetical protein